MWRRFALCVPLVAALLLPATRPGLAAPRTFDSLRRSRFWQKRCKAHRRPGLTRATALPALRLRPVSLFAALAKSRLHRLSTLTEAKLKQRLASARRKPRGAARRERLGALCYARALHHRRRAAAAGLQHRQARLRGKKASAAKRRQATQQRLTRQWLERALAHYRAVVGMGHGSYKRQAGPLFRVASLSMELATHPDNRRLVKPRLKYATLVLKSLSSLLRHHPRSRYIELALLAKAAMYFHLGQYAESTKVLKQVRKWYTREAPYAMYLLGWSLHRAGQHGRARVHLRAATRSSRSSPALVRFARQDLVQVTSHLSKPRKAYRYFQQSVKGRDKRPARQMLWRLARVYVARGKRREAIALYRWFLTKWAGHKRACRWVRALEGLVKKP